MFKKKRSLDPLDALGLEEKPGIAVFNTELPSKKPSTKTFYTFDFLLYLQNEAPMEIGNKLFEKKFNEHIENKKLHYKSEEIIYFLDLQSLLIAFSEIFKEEKREHVKIDNSLFNKQKEALKAVFISWRNKYIHQIINSLQFKSELKFDPIKIICSLIKLINRANMAKEEKQVGEIKIIIDRNIKSIIQCLSLQQQNSQIQIADLKNLKELLNHKECLFYNELLVYLIETLASSLENNNTNISANSFKLDFSDLVTTPRREKLEGAGEGDNTFDVNRSASSTISKYHYPSNENNVHDFYDSKLFEESPREYVVIKPSLSLVSRLARLCCCFWKNSSSQFTQNTSTKTIVSETSKCNGSHLI